MAIPLLSARIESLPVEHVYPDLNQPRKFFDLGSIYELSNSIKRSGLIKPILVERIPGDLVKDRTGLEAMLGDFDKEFGDQFMDECGLRRRIPDPVYLIVVGHRRFEAHWRAGIRYINAQVLGPISIEQRLSVQVAEDSQEAIPPAEVAEDIAQVYYELCRLEGSTLPITTVAQRLGRSHGEVQRALDFHDLCKEVKTLTFSGLLSYSCAAAIGKLKTVRLQQELAHEAVVSRYSVGHVEDRVRELEIPSQWLSDMKRQWVIEQRLGGADMGVIADELVDAAKRDIHDAVSEARKPSDVIESAQLDRIVQEADALEEDERQRFLVRHQPLWSKEVRAEVTQLFLPTDFFGTPIQPTPDGRYARIRDQWYQLFNSAYRSLAVASELQKVDTTLSRMLKAKELDMLVQDAQKVLEGVRRKRAHNHKAGRFIDARGRAKLSAGGYDPQYVSESRIVEIPIEHLRPDKRNVRKSFSRQSIELLATNITHNGLIEPLLVERVRDDAYRIVTGHRRYFAHKIAGIPVARCIRIDHLSSVDRKIIQIIEDSQKPFRPEERARYWFMLYRLRASRSKDGFGVRQFASSVGKSESSVRQALSFLTLPEVVRHLVDLSVLTYSAACEISYLPQRATNSSKRYAIKSDQWLLDPASLAPLNAFSNVQERLALRAAYFGLSRREVKGLVREYCGIDDEQLLFDRDTLESLAEDGERQRIVSDVVEVVSELPKDVHRLYSRSANEEYRSNVCDYPLMVDKLNAVRDVLPRLVTKRDVAQKTG